MPSTHEINSLINQGLAFHENGQFNEAKKIYKKILSFDPNNFSGLQLLGTLLSQTNQHDQAIAYLSAAIKINPHFAPCHNNIGLVFHALNQHDKALESFSKAISCDHNYAEPYFNKGNTLAKINLLEEAVDSFAKAIEINPTYQEAYFSQALTFQQMGKFQDAIESYDHLILLNPNDTEAYFNKGYIYSELKEFDHAISMYDKVLALQPNFAEALFGKGYVFEELRQFEAALLHYEMALSLKPNYAHAHFQKGKIFEELGQSEAAAISYQKSVLIDPEIDWGIGSLVHQQMKNLIWKDLKKNIISIKQKVSENKKVVTPFAILSIIDEPHLHKKAAEIFQLSQCAVTKPQRNPKKITKNDRIRLGYISPDFKTSPVGMLTAELFEMHNRNKFETFGFSLCSSCKNDELRHRIEKGVDKFVDASKLFDDIELAKLINSFDIDIAIDLAGYTNGGRPKIYNYRVAPIQINWLGFPGTTGSTNFDYIIGDETVTPTSHHIFYSEKVIHLPNSLMIDDSQRHPSSKVFTRNEFDLPENSFVFCSFNNVYKFNPNLFDSWAKILAKVENSVLWLPKNNQSINNNIVIEFTNRGINPSRIIFAEKMQKSSDHLARLGLADLFLDSFPYGAQTTALDSLKGGLPILTLCGNSHPSRIASSLLTSINLKELITFNQDEYENLAIDFGLNNAKLINIKNMLLKNLNSTLVFDTSSFTKNLESAYSLAYDRYYDNLEPEHIFIK